MVNKQILKKIMSALIVSVMIVTAFSSCANNENAQENTTTTENSNESANSAEEEQEEAEPKLLPNLDADADFGGYNFRIVTNNWDSADWKDWVPRDIAAEEETGDPINDAVYARNSYLEGLYNFTVEQVKSTSIITDIRKAVSAGDHSFDAAETGIRDTPALAEQGNLVNLHEVPNLDLDQPWWDQGAVESLSIGGKLFFTNGDLVLVAKDACPGILFNKQLLAELQLENPYELVRKNQWTIAKLNEMAKVGANDVNGNGILDYTEYQVDRYGFIGQRDTQIAVFHGAGGRIAEKDAEDMPMVVFGQEKSFSAMEGCYDIMYDYTFTLNLHHLEKIGLNDKIYPISEEIFQSDRALFMWCRLRIVQNLRGMETDFGILPMPKLNETQQEWGSTVNSYTGQTLSIVNIHDADSLERTGHILEALAAESKYTVIPAYYDTQLKTKIARDDDSSEMLDIIFNNTVWDIGDIYNWGNLSSDLIYMSMESNRNIASTFEKAEPRMVKAIEQVVRRYENLD